MPPYLASKLDFIFDAMTIKSSDNKEYGIHSALHALLPIFTKLTNEGIVLFTGTPKERKVHIIMAKMLGDNLGLHSVCGFRPSFVMNRPCLYCEMTYNDLKYAVNIEQDLMRTVAKYVEYFDSEQKAYDYGVECVSVLNRFPNFHVIENMVVDPMHDVKLGYITFILNKAFKYFITTYPNFNLKLLNERIQSFDYGNKLNANKPGLILESHINNKLHLNASESMTLLRLFPLIVYGLIPYPDPIYKLILKTIVVVEKIYAWEFSEETIVELNHLITENKRNYINAFNTTLKPKDHHMLHYSAVIEENGPLRGLATIRLEAKHQVIKNYTNNNKNRKLICYGVSKKLALEFSYFLFKSRTRNILSCIADFNKGKEVVIRDADLRSFLIERQLVPDNFFFGSIIIFKST